MLFNNNNAKQAGRKYNNTWELNTGMSKIAFISIIAATAAILSLFTVAITNAYASEEDVKKQ
jgi:hypothetical protein